MLVFIERIIMKKILLFLLFLSNLLATNKIYNVAFLRNWEPYYFIDSNGNTSGYAKDLFEEIAKKQT